MKTFLKDHGPFIACMLFVCLALFWLVVYVSELERIRQQEAHLQSLQQYILITTGEDYIVTDLQTYRNYVIADWNGSEIRAYGNFTVIEYKEGNK